MAKKKKNETPEDVESQLEAEETPEAAEAKEEAPEAVVEHDSKPRRKLKRGMRVGHAKGKLINNARQGIDKTDRKSLSEALDILWVASPKRKFDESVELVMKLGVDPRKQGQALRGAITLPNGVGKTNRVIAFIEGPDEQAVKDAGAIETGGEELAKRIMGGWDDFDVCIAHPSMMKYVGKLGKILGPKGKMPTPKNGTVTADVVVSVKEFAAGKSEYRADQSGNVQLSVGKRSFDKETVKQNIEFFIEHIRSIRPAEVKGTYIQKIFVTTTMGPSVPVVTSE